MLYRNGKREMEIYEMEFTKNKITRLVNELKTMQIKIDVLKYLAHKINNNILNDKNYCLKGDDLEQFLNVIKDMTTHELIEIYKSLDENDPRIKELIKNYVKYNLKINN